MPFSSKKPKSPKSPLRKRRSSWSDLWLKNTNTNTNTTNTRPLKHVVYAMNFQAKDAISKSKSLITPEETDRTLLLPDVILVKILEKLPHSQRDVNSLVCKRWMRLQGGVVRSIKVFDWGFVESGRLVSRFPNLTNVHLVNACLIPPCHSGTLVNHKLVSFHVDSLFLLNWDFVEENVLSVEMVDRGLRALARGCPNLRKLVVMNASELGLLSVGEECSNLLELELHKCNDSLLRGIAACENVQVLRLIGSLDGFYSSLVSDVGLTILAQGCKRLIKLELSGCEGSFDGIKAIGQCCEVLEELTICDHRMDDGWLAALSYFENLKTLIIMSCKRIDPSPGPDEFLGSCPALKRLHLQKCWLQDKQSARALFWVCEGAREVVFQDCWGLDDETFGLASSFRRVKFLSLEGCSLLTTAGLETLILSFQELESLKVVSCKNIKDSEISQALSSSFSLLKELQWRPDTRSHLASKLEGTGIGRKGGKFFKKR